MWTPDIILLSMAVLLDHFMCEDLKAVTVQGGVSEVQNFLSGQGLNAGNLADDVKKVSGTASDALTQAKPTVDNTLFTLSKSSPALLAEYALGAVALYYLVRYLDVSFKSNCLDGVPEEPVCSLSCKADLLVLLRASWLGGALPAYESIGVPTGSWHHQGCLRQLQRVRRQHQRSRSSGRCQQ